MVVGYRVPVEFWKKEHRPAKGLEVLQRRLDKADSRTCLAKEEQERASVPVAGTVC